jgi:hypothetical protein
MDGRIKVLLSLFLKSLVVETTRFGLLTKTVDSFTRKKIHLTCQILKEIVNLLCQMLMETSIQMELGIQSQYPNTDNSSVAKLRLVFLTPTVFHG